MIESSFLRTMVKNRSLVLLSGEEKDLKFSFSLQPPVSFVVSQAVFSNLVSGSVDRERERVQSVQRFRRNRTDPPSFFLSLRILFCLHFFLSFLLPSSFCSVFSRLFPSILFSGISLSPRFLLSSERSSSFAAALRFSFLVHHRQISLLFFFLDAPSSVSFPFKPFLLSLSILGSGLALLAFVISVYNLHSVWCLSPSLRKERKNAWVRPHFENFFAPLQEEFEACLSRPLPSELSVGTDTQLQTSFLVSFQFSRSFRGMLSSRRSRTEGGGGDGGCLSQGND